LKEQTVTKTHGIENPKREPLRKRLFTIPEASVYLGRSVPSLRELIWAGSLPCVKVGKRIHLDIYDLDKWIDAHKTRYTF